MTDIEVEILQKILRYADEGGGDNNLKKMVVMKLRMEGYEASLCKTCWLSSFHRPKGLLI